MTTCVFITGTNAVGKSSVARAIMDRCGGISAERDMVTYLADGVTCLAGHYLGCKYGGVDRITNAKGSSQVVLRSLPMSWSEACPSARSSSAKGHL